MKSIQKFNKTGPILDFPIAFLKILSALSLIKEKPLIYKFNDKILLIAYD
jgi:hypothetical protein